MPKIPLEAAPSPGQTHQATRDKPTRNSFTCQESSQGEHLFWDEPPGNKPARDKPAWDERSWDKPVWGEPAALAFAPARAAKCIATLVVEEKERSQEVAHLTHRRKWSTRAAWTSSTDALAGNSASYSHNSIRCCISGLFFPETMQSL